MKELLVLRHAETEWNVEGRLQGALDSPLTKNGLSQIEAMRCEFEALDLNIWNWFSSPSGRAVETASRLMQDPTLLRKDARLREIEIGSWQGRLRASLPLPNPPLMSSDGPIGFYLNTPGIETMLSLRARCRSFLNSLTRSSVVVTHGIASRMLRAEAMGLGDTALVELPGGQGRFFRLELGGSDIAKMGLQSS